MRLWDAVCCDLTKISTCGVIMGYAAFCQCLVTVRRESQMSSTDTFSIIFKLKMTIKLDNDYRETSFFFFHVHFYYKFFLWELLAVLFKSLPEKILLDWSLLYLVCSAQASIKKTENKSWPLQSEDFKQIRHSIYHYTCKAGVSIMPSTRWSSGGFSVVSHRLKFMQHTISA